MLQLQSKKLDICRISKVLVKYNVKASIVNDVITLDGDISDDLISNLLDGIDIHIVRNFMDEMPVNVQNEVTVTKKEETLVEETAKESEENGMLPAVSSLPQNTKEYDLVYSKVKRGEVYLCDYGDPYGSEQGYIRYAIVVQNDDGNRYSPTTIVVACTTENKATLPVHYEFTFSSENMLDYDVKRIGSEKNLILAEQIRTIDKTRLRRFLGTMTSEFMEKIQNLLNISLNLNRKVEKVIEEKIVYIEKPVSTEVPVKTNTDKKRQDINMVQIELLSMVDTKELLKISKSSESDEVKAEKILKLYGFDLQRQGVQYLFKAILVSPKEVYFNLETLARNISESEVNVEKEEIKRLIVARVKEQFKFKKAPTIDFIRLVNSFLVKKEDGQYEENNI